MTPFQFVIGRMVQPGRAVLSWPGHALVARFPNGILCHVLTARTGKRLGIAPGLMGEA